jgi:hypothetical protein
VLLQKRLERGGQVVIVLVLVQAGSDGDGSLPAQGPQLVHALAVLARPGLGCRLPGGLALLGAARLGGPRRLGLLLGRGGLGGGLGDELRAQRSVVRSSSVAVAGYIYCARGCKID